MKKLFCIAISLTLSLTFLFGCGKKTFDAPPNSTDSALELTIYGFDAESEKVFGLVNLGHAFLSIKNVSSAPLTVGGFVLPADNEVSIGTWGQNAHWGIWYNLESTYMAVNRYDGRVSLTQGINLLQLDSINAYLLANDKWTPFKNCSYFAVDVWNTVSDSGTGFDFGGLVTPSRVSKRIRATNGFLINRIIKNFGSIGFSNSGLSSDFQAFEFKA